MNLAALKIDPEFQGKIPPLTFEELNQLETNILRDGRIIDPIVVWEGLIVDGHNRFTIARKHPEIPFTVHEKEFASRYEAIIWICKNQLGRRNLTPEQKKYLIGKQYDAEKSSHGAGNGFRGNQYRLVNAENRHLPDKMQTCKRIAKENGVGKTYVKDAAQYAKGVDAAEEAVPGTRQKVLSGAVKPTAAEIAAVARIPPEERPALVAEICKPKEQKKVAAQKEKLSPTVAVPLPDANTSDEGSTHTLAAQEPAFSQETKEPLKVDRKQILEIANGRYHARQVANGAAMLCEIAEAADSMIRRWEITFREYPDILTDADDRAAVKRSIQKVRKYLQDLEEKMEDTL